MAAGYKSGANIDIPNEVKRARRTLALGLEAFAMAVWSDAKQNHIFRNRTGELEKSIRVQKADDGDVSGKVVYQVLAGVGWSAGPSGAGPGGGAHIRAGAGGSDKAYYALYIELGTKRMRSRPFLRPALWRQMRQFLPTLAAQFKAAYGARRGGRR